MIVVAGEIDIQMEDCDGFAAAALNMAHATRMEDGCIAYSFYADISFPGRFHVYEEWQSEEALAAHAASDHMKTWRETLGGLNVLSRDVRKMEVTNVTKI
jgi:quinol monooxygenase YgiN